MKQIRNKKVQKREASGIGTPEKPVGKTPVLQGI
jgi:hypothetical protein